MKSEEKNFKRKRFISNTIMQYILTFAKYIFPFIIFPYLTRVLEPDVYGVVTYMTATVSYFQTFIDFGFNLSATKVIAEHKEDRKHIGEVLGSVIQAKLILALCSIVIYTAMIPFISLLRENILLSYLYIGSVIITVWLPDFIFLGIERMEPITIRFIISKIITTGLTFVLVNSKNDVVWIPILNIIGSLVAIILTWYQIKVKMLIKVYYISVTDVINKIKESAIYFLSTFATMAFGATNTFILGIMALPPTQIAYWGVSYNLISAAQSLYTPITNSLYPHMVSRKDFKLVKKILIIFMPLIIFTTMGVCYFAQPVIRIFCGAEYIGGVPVFKALLPVLIFSFPVMVIGFPVLGAIGKVKEVTLTTVISAIFHILGLFILVVFRKFTIFNVAILRSLTEFILLIARVYVLLKTKNLRKTF